MNWSHVAIFALKGVPNNRKLYAHAVMSRLFNKDDCVHVLVGDDVQKVTQPVDAPSALLVGMHSRPSRAQLNEWSEQLNSPKNHVMLGHKVWNTNIDLFGAMDVAPNLHRICLNDDEQVAFDVAVTDDFRRKTCSRHPKDLLELYSSKGLTVGPVKMERALDGRPKGYDVSLSIGDSIDHNGLVSIGRHRHFSGLLVPA